MRSVWRFQLVRFALVGALNTGFSYLVYAALVYLGVPYPAANFAALVLGICFSFRTQGRLVFGNREDRLIFRFAACWGVIWLFNIGFIAALVHFGFGAYVAGAIAIIPTATASYFVQKMVVFGGPNSGRGLHRAGAP